MCIILAFVQSGCLIDETKPATQTIIVTQSTTEAKITTSKVTTQHKEICVYITKTGSKYHEYYCGCLWNSCIEILLQDTIIEGYTPCNRCQPPIY